MKLIEHNLIRRWSLAQWQKRYIWTITWCAAVRQWVLFAFSSSSYVTWEGNTNSKGSNHLRLLTYQKKILQHRWYKISASIIPCIFELLLFWELKLFGGIWHTKLSKYYVARKTTHQFGSTKCQRLLFTKPNLINNNVNELEANEGKIQQEF